MAWCPDCKKEYDVETGVCPVCGELLEENTQSHDAGSCSGDCSSCDSCDSCGDGSEFGSFAMFLTDEDDHECSGNCDHGIWPLDDDGEPVKPALLTTVMGNQIDYEMALAMLRSFGIPSVKDFPAAGQVAKVLFGFTGQGMDVYVPENMVEIARELMQPVEDDAE